MSMIALQNPTIIYIGRNISYTLELLIQMLKFILTGSTVAQIYSSSNREQTTLRESGNFLGGMWDLASQSSSFTVNT